MLTSVACQDCSVVFKARRIDALRCEPCKKRHRKEYLREYDHGKRRGQCVDCGSETGARAERCLVCSNKYAGRRRSGEHNGNWKQGRTKNRGYVYVRVHPPGHKDHPYRAEHRVVWEQTHGKPIPKGWVVHHLNGVKDDNRPENLAAMPRHEHHSHPREALKPYETRIRSLEEAAR
jgi:hypothetical protein